VIGGQGVGPGLAGWLSNVYRFLTEFDGPEDGAETVGKTLAFVLLSSSEFKNPP
jgi:hypothetical protein